MGEDFWVPLAGRLGIAVTPAVTAQLDTLRRERAEQQARKQDPAWKRAKKKKEVLRKGKHWKEDKENKGATYGRGCGYEEGPRGAGGCQATRQEGEGASN
eukprot:jgi/Mesvir1/29608/Mv21463-RA.1